MRNLKKVLSLSLALVMLIGMMVVGAGAAAYTDTVGNDKSEAIEVMSAINVFTGDGTGKFNPDSTLSRAEAAMIVARVRATPDVVKNLGAVDSRFPDMKAPAYAWATGAVEMCAMADIIAGDSNGNFNPTDKVTGIQFAKMLLVTLGFDAARYTNNANWQLNIRQDAIAAKLTENGVAITNDPMKREAAAQMAFNAVTKYSPSGSNGYVLNNPNGTRVDAYKDTVFATMNDAIMMKLASGTDGDSWLVVPSEAADTLAATRFDLSSENITDEFGRTVKAWSVKGQKDPVYVTGESIETPVMVYTSAKSADELEKELKGYKVKDLRTTGAVDKAIDDASANSSMDSDIVYENGTTATSLGAAAATKPSTLIAGKTGNGKIVEIYATNKVITKIVVVTKTVVTLSSDVSTRVYNDVEQVSVPGVTGGYQDVSRVFGWEDLAKGDVLLYVVANSGSATDKTWHIEKAEAVSGVVAGLNTTKGLLLNGNYYNESDLSSALFKTANKDGWTNFKDEYTFYLDNGGFIVVAKAGEQTAGETNYAVALRKSWVAGTGELDNSTFAQAELLFADGTKKIVTVAKVDNTKLDAQGKMSALALDKVYTYTESSGKYTLTDAEATSIQAGDPTAAVATNYKLKVEKGKAAMTYKYDEDGATATEDPVDVKIPVNANTVFMVRTTIAPTVFAYTPYVGNANVISLEDAAAEVVTNSAGIAVFVYMTDSTESSAATKDYVYILKDSTGSISYTAIPKANGSGTDYYVVDAIYNGETTTVKVATKDNLVAAAANADVSSRAAAETMYTVEGATSAGVINKLVAATPTTGVVVSGGTLVTGSNAYTVNDSTRVVYINEDNVANEIGVAGIANDETDEVYVVANQGVASVVYIKQVVATETDPTVAIAVAGAASDKGVDGSTVTWTNATSKYTADVDLNSANKTAAIGDAISLDITVPAGATCSTPITSKPSTSAVKGTSIGGSSYVVSGTDADGDKVIFSFVVTFENGASRNYEVTVTLDAPKAVKDSGIHVTVNGTPATGKNWGSTQSDTVSSAKVGDVIGVKVDGNASYTVKIKNTSTATVTENASSSTLVAGDFNASQKTIVFEISVKANGQDCASKCTFTVTLPAAAS